MKGEIAGHVVPTIIKHIVEKQHDDWQYSVELIFGPADNRQNIKVRGDDLEKVKKELKELKEAAAI